MITGDSNQQPAFDDWCYRLVSGGVQNHATKTMINQWLPGQLLKLRNHDQ